MSRTVGASDEPPPIDTELLSATEINDGTAQPSSLLPPGGQRQAIAGGPRPPAKQQIQFLVPAHQRRQRINATIGIEAAFRYQGTLHPPAVNRFGDPFQLMFA